MLDNAVFLGLRNHKEKVLGNVEGCLTKIALSQ